MKKNINFLAAILAFFALSLIVTNKVSAQAAAESVESTYKAENPGWITNLDEAFALSKKTNKPIMANFTGSDWCGWCKKLTASVFATPEFKVWAQKNVVLLELDFPRGKQIPEKIRVQNSNMQQAFQVSGYPTVWVFDLEKDEVKNNYNVVALGKTGYRATVKEFTSEVDAWMASRVKK
jgi:thiol:disulfide interchange protein